MISLLHHLLRKIKVSFILRLVERAQNVEVIQADINRWVKVVDDSRQSDSLAEKLLWLMYGENIQEFRNLVFYRLSPGRNWMERSLLGISKYCFKPREVLEIASPSIGPGLVIMHGVETVIAAERIGENCMIFHDVFIGPDLQIDERPVLGNFVHVSAGARVLGKITIGDHAVIAANATIDRDMPPNSLAIGIPARILANAGNKAEYIANGLILGEQQDLPQDLAAAQELGS